MIICNGSNGPLSQLLMCHICKHEAAECFKDKDMESNIEKDKSIECIKC